MGRDIVASAVAVLLAFAGFLFDIFAFYPGLMSIDSNRTLLPDFVWPRDLTVAEMQRSFRTWSVTSLLLRRPGAFRDPLAPDWTKPELATLRRDWIAAIVEQPGAAIPAVADGCVADRRDARVRARPRRLALTLRGTSRSHGSVTPRQREIDRWAAA